MASGNAQSIILSPCQAVGRPALWLDCSLFYVTGRHTSIVQEVSLRKQGHLILFFCAISAARNNLHIAVNLPHVNYLGFFKLVDASYFKNSVGCIRHENPLNRNLLRHHRQRLVHGASRCMII